MSFNIIEFLDEYQSVITAIVVTSTIIYILVDRWWERRKLKSNGKERVINKKE